MPIDDETVGRVSARYECAEQYRFALLAGPDSAAEAKRGRAATGRRRAFGAGAGIPACLLARVRTIGRSGGNHADSDPGLRRTSVHAAIDNNGRTALRASVQDTCHGYTLSRSTTGGQASGGRRGRLPRATSPPYQPDGDLRCGCRPRGVDETRPRRMPH